MAYRELSLLQFQRTLEKQMTDRLLTACINANPVTFAELRT